MRWWNASCPDARPTVARRATPSYAATTVLALDLNEASAKMRTGPPIDDDDDLVLEHWAGVIPIGEHRGPPDPDPLFIAQRGGVVPELPRYLR